MRDIFFAGVALLGLCGLAQNPAQAANVSNIKACPLINNHYDCSQTEDVPECINDAGEEKLSAAIQRARYDVTSPEYLAWKLLGFNQSEWNRSEQDQERDAIGRAAQLLDQYNDSVVLTMADARNLQYLFYQDSIICLHNGHVSRHPTVSHGGEVKVIVAPAQSAPKAWSTQPAAIPDPALTSR